jgi:hypothetical protein
MLQMRPGHAQGVGSGGAQLPEYQSFCLINSHDRSHADLHQPSQTTLKAMIQFGFPA